MSAQPSQPQSEPKPQDSAKNSALEKFRITKAYWLSIIGLGIAAALVIALLIAGWQASEDIVAVVGLFTSVLGTLVGAFFGLQIGSAGKAQAEERADDAQKRAETLAAAADEPTIKRAKALYSTLFLKK
jgi:hypothetical protein